jgi:hypothetical protein
MTGLFVIADIWIHLVSTAVVDTGIAVTGTVDQDGAGNFSRVFAPPANASQAPWRLQQGLQTFLEVNSLNTVLKLNTSTVLLPKTLPQETDIVATTLGIEMSCDLLNSGCTFSQTTSSAPLIWDCSSVEAGASGILSNPLTNPVNTTFLPNPASGTTSNATSNFTILSAMAIPSVFNASTTITVAQVFRCTGSLQNITYSFSAAGGGFQITQKSDREVSPLVELLESDSVPGKAQLLEEVGRTVAQSTIFVQGMNVEGIGGVYEDGLGRMFVAFLAGEMIPAPSLKVLYRLPTLIPHTSTSPVPLGFSIF